MYIMSIIFIYQYTWYHDEFANQTDHGIILTFQFPPTAECFGVSAHIAFGVIRGTGRHCCLARVPGTEKAPG